MKNKLIDAILIIVMVATAVGASVAIYNSQTVTSSVQSPEQIGGYPAPYQGYPIGYPVETYPPSHGIILDPIVKVPTGQPTPFDFTPAPKMTPTIEPTPIKDPEI